ncbi:hypothetical protein HPB50_026574 [Hyalomma asiaticum]|uniref:Uncharacterized protein n=1 Tax=Hyalomma asiaticum TaxID=266040 RepID=A0ACB7TP48_HYAAI|nr:hypothetical protein HPB50_026574 [Hyalomma asiaticum]
MESVDDQIVSRIRKKLNDESVKLWLPPFTVNDQEDDPSSRYYMQIADQTGKPIALPMAEKRALGVAMVLHEKGRAALKRKKYTEALLLLLEADKEFRTCNSALLANVDNYALLCLDIAWCYLSLRSVDQLFDAEARLKECENGFRRSYGENLERLTAIKAR